MNFLYFLVSFFFSFTKKRDAHWTRDMRIREHEIDFYFHLYFTIDALFCLLLFLSHNDHD